MMSITNKSKKLKRYTAHLISTFSTFFGFVVPVRLTFRLFLHTRVIFNKLHNNDNALHV